MSPLRRPIAQVRVFVGMSNIYQQTAGKEATRLMSIMATASHGRQVFSLLSFCLRGEGI
jgi:hypothetical protein